MKKAQYICAWTAVGMYVLMLVYAWVVGPIPDPLPDVVFILIVLTAAASAAIASVIRYREKRVYAYSVFIALVLFSLIYSVAPHTVTFVLSLGATAVSAFVLAYGAYNSRKDKGSMVTYILGIFVCAIWFLSTCVGV